jgi:hypothetical protein
MLEKKSDAGGARKEKPARMQPAKVFFWMQPGGVVKKNY